jgi:hypothetical protein
VEAVARRTSSSPAIVWSAMLCSCAFMLCSSRFGLLLAALEALRRRLLAILREAEERCKHELMYNEERMLLLDRIRRLRRRLGVRGSGVI